MREKGHRLVTFFDKLGRGHYDRGLVYGAGNVTRTHDLLITNQLLYRLSYASTLARLWILAHLHVKVNIPCWIIFDYSLLI